jgi:hypothetical protein
MPEVAAGSSELHRDLSLKKELILSAIQDHLTMVVSFNPSEKYEFVSWDYCSQDMEK